MTFLAIVAAIRAVIIDNTPSPLAVHSGWASVLAAFVPEHGLTFAGDWWRLWLGDWWCGGAVHPLLTRWACVCLNAVPMGAIGVDNTPWLVVAVNCGAP